VRAAESRLDEYERTRRPVATRVVGFTHRLTQMATLRTPSSLAANALIRVVGRITWVRRRVAMELSELRTPSIPRDVGLKAGRTGEPSR